jgi:hypothetical protein
MSKTHEMKELMHILVQSLHNRARKYHYKLTGDSPECLSRLIELDEAGMHHLLHKCGLFDEKSKKYKNSGVIDQHDMFHPCTILNFVRITYSQEKERNVNTKDYYLTVGKDTVKNELRLPCNQYRHKTSPGCNDKKKNHYLEIYPPTIRLNREEKELAEKLKVLVFQSMPMTVRRKQKQSCKKVSAGGALQPSSISALQPSSLSALPPSSSSTKKTTLSTVTPPLTRNSKSGILDLLHKSLTRFVMEEGGSICVD